MTFTEVTILVIVAVTNFVLMGLVYYRNSGSATHRLFALQALVINLYLIANAIAVNARTELLAIWSIRAVMFFAAPMSVLFFLLMHTFPRSTMAMSKRALWAWTGVTLFTMALTLTPYVFSSATLVANGPPSPVPAPGMAVFAIVGVGTIPLGLYYLIRKRQKATGLERTQMNFLLLGVSLMFTFIISLIFIGTVVLGNSLFAQYAPVFTIPFVGLTAYVIIRHRLLDIRAALFRGLSLTVLVGAVLGIYGLLVVFAVPLVATAVDVGAELLAGAAALVSIPIARYIQQFLTKLTDKFLFQNRADYSRALVDLGQELSGTIVIREATQTVLEAMKQILRARKAVILLWEEERLEFAPHASYGAGKFEISIPTGHPLVTDVRIHKSVIIKDEERLAAEKETDPIRSKQERTAVEAFEWLDVAAVVPLFVNKELTGLILLGEKLSGAPYLRDDVDFLDALAPQAATALENARLYQQAQEFNVRLREEVEEATEELEMANIQLKNLDKAKSEFLSIASHQLYTPLTALRGYISMMKDGDFGEVPDKQEPVLDILEKSASRLIALIKNLLDVSRIESGRLELKLESIDLVELAKELVADLMPNAIAKNLQLKFHIPAGATAHVVVDRERLRQVMLNFVDNAIKYTVSGRIDVHVYQKGEYIVFSVKDTGKGIKREDIARLFNKFMRVGGASRFHTEGTGLGLYVARQIVREHRGEIHVDSPGENQGSTFAMQLPAEGTSNSLRPGEETTVDIKAAEAQPLTK